MESPSQCLWLPSQGILLFSFSQILLLISCQYITCQRLHSSAEISSTDLILLNKNDLCQKHTSADPLILVKSGINNRKERDSIRSTWADYAWQEFRVKTLFVLGSSSDATVMRSVLEEDIKNNDILLSFFNDAYYNLTLKTIFTLNWISTYCDDRWILYVDDDSLVNVDLLTKVTSKSSDYNSITCRVLRNKPPYRTAGSKWFVPKSVWSQSNYPDYCLGIGFLLPPEAGHRLRDAAVSNETQPKLWIDDVFVTGIATTPAKLKLSDSDAFSCCGSKLVTKESFKHTLVFGEVKPPSVLIQVWTNMTGRSPVPDKQDYQRVILKTRSAQSRLLHQNNLPSSIMYITIVLCCLFVILTVCSGSRRSYLLPFLFRNKSKTSVNF